MILSGCMSVQMHDVYMFIVGCSAHGNLCKHYQGNAQLHTMLLQQRQQCLPLQEAGSYTE